MPLPNEEELSHFSHYVVNRFEWPYSSVNTKKKFDVEDLFELEKMAFAVEFALAVAEKDTSVVQIKNKQDLYHALTDTETLYKILEQALDYLLSDEKYIGEYRDNKDRVVDYFMKIKESENRRTKILLIMDSSFYQSNLSFFFICMKVSKQQS